MNENKPSSAETIRQPIRVRLPGFIGEEPVGLGDIIKKTTRTLGIKPCGGCQARANALNGWMVFTGK